MEDLAGRLCEAVENEDSKEVENLLRHGADPNFVLPSGIAAIHLASGKESECALRCLTMILEHGGNPNVRSADDLTPLHVAASWGCCKALVFLLRKGGDPSIQDQDGNTALDLALIENNKKCVVTLQEYEERISDGYADEIRELSCITLLLESAYENSPLSSTKISPITSFPKTVILGNHLANEAISSQIEIPTVYTKDESRKEPEMCSSILRDERKLKPNEAKVPDLVTTTSQGGHCSEYFPTDTESDITLHNSSMDQKMNGDVSNKICFLVDDDSENNARKGENEEITLNAPINSSTNSALLQHVKCDKESGLNRGVTDFQVVQKLEGLDETSPDQESTFSDERMEHPMVTSGKVSTTEDLEKHEPYSRSRNRDCNTSLKPRGGVTAGTGMSNGICNWDTNDGRILSNKHSYKTMNAQSSGIVDAWKIDVQEVENKRLAGTCTQISNERNQIFTAECLKKSLRTSEIPCTSESPTLPVEATNNEHGSQELKIKLKALLLSTKGCYRPTSEAVCADTVPVSSDTKWLQQRQAFHQKMKAGNSSSSSSEDTLTVETREHPIAEKGDSEFQKNLKKLMLGTKDLYSPSTMSEDKSGFFTPRTKSRLHSYKSRQDSSLFDDSLEMPRRGRRVRSPDGLLPSSTDDLAPDKLLPRRSSNSTSGTNEPIKMLNTLEELHNANVKILPEIKSNEVPQDHKENNSSSESTPRTSYFLTDDLSSEAEDKSCRQLNQSAGNHCLEDGISKWLTEDSESEMSGVNDQRNKIGFTMEEKSRPTSLLNGSFLHSTLVEDNTAVNSCKATPCSFSRLSCIPKADESTLPSYPRMVCESAEQEVPLSPGGRPVNVSQAESVEYLYKDNEKGHTFIEKRIPSIDQSGTAAVEESSNTIIYDWRNYKTNAKASSINAPNRVAVELYRLSNDEIASRLRGLGVDSVQITSQNRKMCISLLDRRLKEQRANGPAGLFLEYSPELCLALNTFKIPDCSKDEAGLSQEFDKPDKTRRWREGVLKESFNYILLDPRVTRNLPSRCHDLSQQDCFRTFVSAVFYIGKGKRSRPYFHLYEALNHYKGNCKPLCSKVQHILEIWRSGRGVLSLHCFQNAIPVEAYTREACMVDAIGLKMLTNQKKGVCYGQVQNWPPSRRRRLGVDMLYKAMQIFLADGERQLRPADICSGRR
ncbi:ankyrin repeat and LEM domain-containing protein 1 [Eleutherodactylus coqui]|uniref:ankyrin repeat and LEM domain-containing protein 1 n=1 Tax=Eleutherodactylus coqui TaxID=57060 RepID=UPI00346268F3